MDQTRLKALALAEGLASSPANIDRVANQTGPEHARWAFNQWDLRARAKSKFSLSSQMVFVREALEQATTEQLASYHASLFPKGELVSDLTCGIGGDLMALAERGPCVGFELDPERAEAATYNLKVAGLQGEVRNEDSLTTMWNWSYALADPARRVEGRRTIDPSEFSPNPVDLAQRFQALKLGVMKLSPLLPDPFLSSLGPSLRFLSCEGECREALVMCGSEATQERLAVHVGSAQTLVAGDDAPYTEQPQQFFYDADPAAVRAHCLGSLAAMHDLRGLGDSRGYLTGNRDIDSPWVRKYRVLYSDKADISKTKKQLQLLNAATPEIKQRHADQSQEQMRKLLRCNGSRRVSLAIWPLGRSLRHTLIEQVA